MRYLKIYEDFNENSENWERFKSFLLEWGLDVSDGSSIHHEFTKLEDDDSITNDRKAKKMSDFIKREVGDFSEDYSEVLDFLEMMFADEI